MNTPRADFDAMIVGANSVGGTLACALADAGLRVAIVETHTPSLQGGTGAYDLRVSALTRASEFILGNVNVWEALRARRVSPFREMHVWTAANVGTIHFDCAAIGEPVLGHVVENNLVQSALWERLSTHAQIAVFCPATPRELTTHDDHIGLTLDDGASVTARVLVGADGAQSWVRQYAGMGYDEVSYRQKSIVATVATELPHRETAWQRFSAHGVIALLPLANGQSSLVWSTALNNADRLMGLDDHAFGVELMHAFGTTLGELRLDSARAGFELRRAHAKKYVLPRVALAGDAAHSVHPLAGQGVNLGLLDAAALAETLIDAQRAHKDIGALPVLRRYERWRKGDNLVMQNAMDVFNRVFAARQAPIRALGGLGLEIANHIPALKNFFMLHAMGKRGDLPRLAL